MTGRLERFVANQETLSPSPLC